MDGVGSLVDLGGVQAAMNQSQQQQLIMDYLAAAMNGGGHAAEAQPQDLQELLAANSQIMESILGGAGNGAGNADLFAQLMNPAMMAPQFPNYMSPAINSTFHKEFLKQIANVQKEQGNVAIAVPAKRPVGRPPMNGGGGSAVSHSPKQQKSRDSTGSTRFACDYCHKTFASRYYLATHIQVHLSQLSPEERKEQIRVIRSPEQLRLLERAEERQRFLEMSKPGGAPSVAGVKPEFKCVKCVAIFADESEFKQHMLEHSVDRPFYCQKCHKTYKYEGSFESHRCQGKNEPPTSDLSTPDLSDGFPSPANDLKRSSYPGQVHIPNQGARPQHRLPPTTASPNDTNNNHHPHMMNKCGLSPSDFASAKLPQTLLLLDDHLRNHHKLAPRARALPCQHCDLQFMTIAELVQHQESSHVGMETKGDLICVVCNSAFKSLVTYYTHIKTHENLYPFSVHVSSSSTSSAMSQNGSQGAFDDADAEELSLNAEEESDLTKFFTEDAEGESRSWNFTCDTCGGMFMREEVHQYHLLLHLGERQYSCGECAKAFKARTGLRLHETQCHRKSEDKVTQVARGGGVTNGGVGNSMAATAALMESYLGGNGMSYQCSICDHMYDNKTALREHEILHSVDGEYTCKVCGKRFRSLIGLKIHSNKHQNDLIQQHLNGTANREMNGSRGGGGGGEAGANATKCLLYYEEVDGMDKERPYICRACDKRFKTKHALPYHMLLHTAETPFGCEFCGKGFRALISLKLHAKKHEDKGWIPNYDHLELVQRQYQQAILMMGETRTVAQGKPPQITEVVPFAKAVAMAPQITNSMIGRSSMRMESEDYGDAAERFNGHRGSSSVGGVGDEEMERDQDEPNIHDFCAVEMMMEPEVEIKERHEDGDDEEMPNGDEDRKVRNGEMDESGFHNGSQYAHLLSDEGEDDEPMMLKNEIKSDDEYPENGLEEDGDDQGDEDHHHLNGMNPQLDTNIPRAKFTTEQLLEKAMQPQPMAINSILKYECPICLKRFKNRLSLPYHMMTHERGDPVNCNYCNRKFVSKMKLRRHLRVKHDVVDPSLGDDENEEPKASLSRFGKFKFACPTCNRKFKSKFTLKLHMKHHHFVRGRPGRPPKVANMPLEQFKDLTGESEGAAALDASMPKISRVESVPSFLNGANVAMLQTLLNKSINGQGAQEVAPAAAPPSVDAQFDCDQCDQKFVTFPEYKLHMKFHLEQIANAASVAVQSSAALNHSNGDMRPKARYDIQNSYRLSKEYEHLRTKDGKYQCNICHKLFKCRQSLPYHMNLHKKNSIFRCLSCKTGFRNLHGFKMHNRIYHKDKMDGSVPRMGNAERVNSRNPPPALVPLVKQELNSSGDHHQEDETAESEHSMASSSYKNHHQNGNGFHEGGGGGGEEEEEDDEEDHTNSSIKQESTDMDVSSLMNQSMTTDQMMTNPFQLFPPALLQLQQFQQLQMQMQQQQQQQMGTSNGEGSSSGSVRSDNGQEKPAIIVGQEPQMRPIELETGERAYLCSLCNKVCRSKQASIYHRMIHTGEKPYKCEICDKRCRSQANLELHKKMHVNEMRAENGGVRRRNRFRSDGGEAGVGMGLGIPEVPENGSLSGLGMLSMMMGGVSVVSGDSSMDPTMQKWRAHADMKFLRCTLCDYKFKSAQALTYHCMIHTNEKPYKCNVCSNSFRSKTNLNLHEKSHQRAMDGGGGQQYDDNMEITLETLQNCPEMANGFLNATAAAHGQGGGVAAVPGTSRNASPTNCYCLVCEKTFRTEGYVRHHQLLVHTVRSDVNVHELPTLIASQDGYMYKCDICQNCFRTKQYYYFHVNTHHPEAGRGRGARNSNTGGGAAGGEAEQQQE